MQTRLVSAVATEPLTLDEAKRQLQIVATDTSFDALITGLIPVVREVAENETAQDLKDTAYETSFSSFKSILVLPRNPVISVTSVGYKDADGNDQTLAVNTDFVLDKDSKPARIYFSNTPTTNGDFNAVKITYRAGYATPAEVPNKTKQAMLMLITHFFENRGNLVDGRFTIELPLGATWLFAKDRIYQ